MLKSYSSYIFTNVLLMPLHLKDILAGEGILIHTLSSQHCCIILLSGVAVDRSLRPA